MPDYIYQCENKHEQGLTHSIKEDPIITCEVCHTQMRRKPQSVAPTFVGSGFYSTDKNA